VERDVVATDRIQATYGDVDQYEAQEDYIAELLDIKDEVSLKSNRRINIAFQKTKLVIRGLCHRLGRRGERVSSNMSFPSLVIIHRLSPFLLWLAAAEDPSCLGTTHDTLLLHEAMKAKNMRIYQLHRLDGCWIQFPPITEGKNLPRESPNVKILDLFNKKTPVQLLCHLTRERFLMSGGDEDRSSSSRRLHHIDPLHVFLRSFVKERQCIERYWTRGRTYDWDNWRGPDSTEFFNDIRAVIGIASNALEICHHEDDTGLYPFCMPQQRLLQHDDSAATTTPWSVPDEDMETFKCFSLNLAFELLKGNPTLVSRHLRETKKSKKRTASTTSEQEDDPLSLSTKKRVRST